MINPGFEGAVAPPHIEICFDFKLKINTVLSRMQNILFTNINVINTALLGQNNGICLITVNKGKNR